MLLLLIQILILLILNQPRGGGGNCKIYHAEISTSRAQNIYPGFTPYAVFISSATSGSAPNNGFALRGTSYLNLMYSTSSAGSLQITWNSDNIGLSAKSSATNYDIVILGA